MRHSSILAGAALLCSVQLMAASPYAGQEDRSIKALADAEVADLLAGNGMGFAKAAELNGYPGPSHVIELAAPLGLSVEQRAQTEALFRRMQTEAKTLGAQLVEAERALDTMFRTRQVTAESLKKSSAEVAALRGQVRSAHLQAHVEQVQILSAEQIAKYVALRGYGKTAGQHSAHHHGQK